MNDHVKTAIRWRPAAQNREVSIEKVSSNIVSIGPQFRTYLFDHVFDSAVASDSQAEVYSVLVQPLIARAFEGYDCTFLAIGQTGSGKTYTVGFDQSVNPEHSGMTARVLQSIFSYQNAEQVKVLISFIEIYNEQAFDLLAENQQEPFYNKENRFSEPTKKSIRSEHDVLSLLAQASRRRHIRDTKMNSASSRSHAVFTIYLGIKHAKADIRESVINIVDLAGSECFGKTGSTLGSEVHLEGKFINESLAALKRVIGAMACGQKYIPFRDSVITTFLKKALNPQSYLTLLGCVSPYQDDYGETLSTVLFVSGAKQLKRTPQLNAVITDFQKSKTPVKAILQTPNSTNAMFKRPASMSTGIPNKRPYTLLPKMMSVQPKKLSFAADSSAFHRFERSSMPSTSNSTTKKTIMLNQQKRFDSLAGNRPKAVTNLFPMPLTPSRRLIENLLNNKNNESNESINFCDASTSSALDVSSINRHRFSTNVEVQSHLGKLLNQLAGPAFQMLSSEVEKRIVKNSDPKLRPNQIMESFHTVLNELLAQDATKDVLPPKNHVELSPLNEQSNESGIALASTSKQSETFVNEDSMAEKQTSNVIAVDVNHAEKQIIVEVVATADDTLSSVPPVPPSTPLASVSLMADSDENPNQSTNVNAGLQPVNLQQLIQLTAKSPVNQPLSKDEVDETINKSYETVINDRMTVQLTPIAAKSNPIKTERTPIGKIRLRKTIPDDTIDDDSAYEIVMVNKGPISQVKKVRFGPLERMSTSTNGANDVGVENAPHVPTAYPLPASNSIASRMTPRNSYFPMAPNMILQRINVLQDYNRCITMQNVARLAAVQQSNRQAKGRPPRSRSAEVTKSVLQLLNSGSQKDLTLLATIGPKTADIIFQNRADRGQFECIDALLRVPSWSKKKHRRFLELNVQL